MSKLNTRELQDLNQLADELVTKLAAIEAGINRVTELWNGLPNEDEVNDLCRSVGTIEASLERIPDLVEGLPDANDLADLANQASNIAADLAQINE